MMLNPAEREESATLISRENEYFAGEHYEATVVSRRIRFHIA